MDPITIDTPYPSITGVKPNVAQAVGKMLASGRRYFGSSGAGLSHQAFNPEYESKGIKPELAKIGLQGERDTTTILKKWMSDKPSVVLCDSVHIRGWGKEEVDEETGLIEGGDTDHILVIGDEIVLIDTKRWKKKSNYTVGDNGEVLRSNRPFPGGNVHMTQAIHMWLDYLIDDASITGIICINSEETIVFRNKNWYTKPYRLVEINRFLELLDEKYKSIDDEDKEHINTSLVSQIVVCSLKPFDPYSRVFDEKALKAFK
jgi:hypothetical protein